MCMKISVTLQMFDSFFDIFGRCTFANSPHWQLNGSILRNEPNINYLGTVLSNNPKAHIDARVQAARRAFYGLQSSGMCEVELGNG